MRVSIQCPCPKNRDCLPFLKTCSSSRQHPASNMNYTLTSTLCPLAAFNPFLQAVLYPRYHFILPPLSLHIPSCRPSLPDWGGLFPPSLTVVGIWEGREGRISPPDTQAGAACLLFHKDGLCSATPASNSALVIPNFEQDFKVSVAFHF